MPLHITVCLIENIMLKDCTKQWRQIVYTVQTDFVHSIWGIFFLGIMGQRVNSD